MSELSSTTSSATQRWWFPLLPIALAFLGPPAMFVGWNLGYLGLPWFTPLFGVAAVLVAVWAMRAKPTWVRGVILLFCLALTSFEVYMIAVGAKLPAYSGPLAVGKPVPAFTTQSANSKPLSEQDLKSELHTVLVFYRGHW